MGNVLERFTPRPGTLVKLENVLIARDPTLDAHPIVVREVCKGSFVLPLSAEGGAYSRWSRTS